MAQNGFIPPAAKAAENVTPCCSAIPTSKHRLGYLSANKFNPVPSGIAAVTAHILESCAACFNKLSANTFV